MSRWGVFVLCCVLAAYPSPGGAATQESLVELVPGNALGVVLLRESALETFRTQLDEDADQERELRDYLTKRVGLDLTAIRAAAAFVTSIEPPQGAVVLRMSSTGKPKWPVSGKADGITIYRPDASIFAAVTKSGLVLGTEAGVRTAIAVSLGKTPALGHASPLGVLVDADRDAYLLAGADIAAIPDPSVKAVARMYGTKMIVAGWTPARVFAWAGGDKAGLTAARDAAKVLIDKLVSDAKTARDKAVAGTDTMAGVGAITGYHGMLKLQKYAPRLDGDRLVIDYTFPKDRTGQAMTGAMTAAALVGVGAAVAIPAFMKYIRRSKTVEATMNVRRVYDESVAYYEEHHAFAASTDWTPANKCCPLPGGKCTPTKQTFAAPGWKALGFSVDEPFYFQYRYVRTATGFDVEARGDLNCDGTFSLFRRHGELTPDGHVTGGKGLYTENEIE